MLCYHHNDLDGKCAAAVVAYYFNNYDPKNYIESDYSGLKTELCREDDKVFIVDYSFTENTMKDLIDICEVTKKVVWIDHHDSSIDLVRNHPELKSIPNLRIRLSKEQSGCYLTYQYFYDASPNEVPLFIQLISDYDNWNHKSLFCIDFVRGLDIEENNPTDEIWKDLFDEWEMYMEGLLEPYSERPLPQFEGITSLDLDNEEGDFFWHKYILDQGAIVSRYLLTQNQSLVDNFGFESYLDNIKCFCLNAKGNSLMFGHKIKEYPMCVTFMFDGEAYNYSVYSEDESISCKEIAERYGGGGHKGAAGFRSPDLLV